MIRKLARRVTLAINHIDSAYYLDGQSDGVTDNALCVMYALDDGESHSQAEICRDWLIPKTTMNSLVKRWEKEGLLCQDLSDRDKRARTLRLTQEGKALARKYLRRVYDAEDSALEKTIAQYGTGFIEALEYYSQELKSAFRGKEQTEL